MKTGGNDSIFAIWAHPEKSEVASGKSQALLAEYVAFCATIINRLLAAIKVNVSPERWTSERKIKNRVLTTIFINGFLIALRHLIANGRSVDEQDLKKRLDDLDKFDLSKFHSSQYARLADEIMTTFFL